MKWHRPQDGEERTLRWFALLPVWDDEDVYWLEWVEVHQQYNEHCYPSKFSKWETYQVIGDSDK